MTAERKGPDNAPDDARDDAPGHAPEKDEPSFTPGKEELQRLLIEQFYEDSLHRYGTDSEQARTLSRLLGRVSDPPVS
jgi:hypothetical protein